MSSVGLSEDHFRYMVCLITNTVYTAISFGVL